MMTPAPSLTVPSLSSERGVLRSPAAKAIEILRLPLAFMLALLLTGGMFWSLSRVIQSKVELEKRDKVAKIDFSRLRRDSEVKMIKRQKPEPIKQVEPPPDAPKITAAEAAALPPSAGPIALGPGGAGGVMVDVKGMLGGGGAAALAVNTSGGADRAELPLVRIQPEYPPRALAKGIEGWTVVEFTISSTGRTKDVTSIQSEPPGVFDQAAVKAVQSWKYNPKIEAGAPVERSGMRVKLNFKIPRA